MNLIPLPAFSDNYIWLLQHQGLALVVDPGDSVPVTNWLAENNHRLDCILVTHHHGDHTGGVAQLQQEWGAKVYGPANEKLPFDYQALTQGQQISWGGLNFQTLDVPGHTAGHIAYFAEPEGQDPLLFCGDTLFSGGCGRLFEGTAVQMLNSMDRLAALPGTSRVCCAHEYALPKPQSSKFTDSARQTEQGTGNQSFLANARAIGHSRSEKFCTASVRQ
jgi:hydroxyacylglutathione hydrolase